MSLNVPAPIARFLSAEKAKDADLLVLCFADDALVHDEGRDYRGRDAIRSWKLEAEAKYRYVMEPLDVSVNPNTAKLRVRLTGDFPGSPIELDYAFVLRNDKITSLVIE
jgi:ketosteroid isomerase-like protein